LDDRVYISYKLWQLSPHSLEHSEKEIARCRQKNGPPTKDTWSVPRSASSRFAPMRRVLVLAEDREELGALTPSGLGCQLGVQLRLSSKVETLREPSLAIRTRTEARDSLPALRVMHRCTGALCSGGLVLALATPEFTK